MLALIFTITVDQLAAAKRGGLQRWEGTMSLAVWISALWALALRAPVALTVAVVVGDQYRRAREHKERKG